MKIQIVGRGNVAIHLHKAFKPHAETSIINPHTLEQIDPDADFIIIAVSDHAIAGIVKRLHSLIAPGAGTVVAHTSGSISMNALETLPCGTGVLYPMQTFSKDVMLDYGEIHFFIEAVDSDTLKSLNRLASLISMHVHEADSRRRKALHVGAVLTCNFANRLWALADRFLAGQGLDFSMMHPLLKETVRKAIANRPADVQTGPAARNDRNVMDSHLSMLADDPEIADIYRIISNSIMESKK